MDTATPFARTLASDEMNCSLLFDSDLFIVVGHQTLGTPAYEIVNKRTNLTAFLYGVAAGGLQIHIDHWRLVTPEQEEVEKVLDGYVQLCTIPLLFH